MEKEVVPNTIEINFESLKNLIECLSRAYNNRADSLISLSEKIKRCGNYDICCEMYNLIQEECYWLEELLTRRLSILKEKKWYKEL